MNSPSTRRPFRPVLAVVSVIGLVSLSACGASSDAGGDEGGESTAAGGSSGGFTWSDARGEQVELDAKPKVVVAQSSVAAALWDAGFQVQGVYGELGETDGELNYQAGNLELDDMTVLGQTYGEFDEVAYASMSPDLLIDFTMTGDDLWYVPPKEAEAILEMAPSVGIKGQGLKDTTTAIERFVDLATELGADTQAADLQAEKKEYQGALDDLAAASKDADDITVALVSFDRNNIYYWNPDRFPEAQTMRQAGVQFVMPKNLDESGWSEALSWEQAGKYEADVIMYDERMAGLMDQVESIPTWSRLPAVQAGQVYSWKTAAPYSYAVYGEIFAEISDWMPEVEDVG